MAAFGGVCASAAAVLLLTATAASISLLASLGFTRRPCARPIGCRPVTCPTKHGGRERLARASVYTRSLCVRARTRTLAARVFARTRHCIHGRGVSSFCFLCVTSGFFFLFFSFFLNGFFSRALSRFARAPDFRPTTPRPVRALSRTPSSQVPATRVRFTRTRPLLYSRNSSQTIETEKWYVQRSRSRSYDGAHCRRRNG